jgi:hypothetical protein
MSSDPRAAEQIHDDGSFGPYFRLRCACCGCPTLEAGTLYLDETPWPQVCLLCDWENAAPDRRVDEDDAVSLTQARANVQRYGWMYDPTHPPSWLVEPPSSEELQMRLDLREVYAAIDEEPSGPRFFDVWEIARTAEDELLRAVRQRGSRSATAQDAEFSNIELTDPGALGLGTSPGAPDDDPDHVV